MDDFNMNNKTPLNSSDQNNEQPTAETRNTAPQSFPIRRIFKEAC